MIVKQC